MWKINSKFNILHEHVRKLICSQTEHLPECSFTTHHIGLFFRFVIVIIGSVSLSTFLGAIIC